MKFTEKLKELNVRKEFIEWAKGYSTLQKAWDNCERGDWIMSLATAKAKSNPKYRKRLALAVCAYARYTLKYIPKDGDIVLKVILKAEKWAKGKSAKDEGASAWAVWREGALAAGWAEEDDFLKVMSNIIRNNLKCPVL